MRCTNNDSVRKKEKKTPSTLQNNLDKLKKKIKQNRYYIMFTQKPIFAIIQKLITS